MIDARNNTLRTRRPRRRSRHAIIGQREAQAIAARLGADLLDARRALRLKQAEVAARVGISPSRYADLERGRGGRAPVETWIALGIAVGRPLATAFSRATTPMPADGGHLDVQEFLLRLGRSNGLPRTFELPNRFDDPTRFADVGLRDDPRRTLALIEVANRIVDFGAAVRTFQRKLAVANEVAVVAGGHGEPYRVASCWVVRATAANRALIAKYPRPSGPRFRGRRAPGCALS